MAQDDRSITRLIGDLAGNISTLFRTEVDLAKAELSEKLNQAGVAVGMIAAGAVLGLAALIVLLQALVIALTEAGIPPGWSSLIVGAVVALVGFLLLRKGLSDLQANKLAPERTMTSLRRDVQAAKEHT